MTPENVPPRLRNVHQTLPRFAAWRTIMALMLREMTSSYGRTPGGYLWAIAEPVLGLAFLVAIFSAGFRSPPLGSNFAIYYATGLFPFMLCMSTIAKVSQSINFSRQLLAYPRVTFVDAILARLLLNCVTMFLVYYILYSVILATMETRTVLQFPVILSAFTMAVVLGLAIGILNAVIMAYYPIWQSVWGITTRPLFLLSGIIFLHDRIPEPYRGWLEWNPLVHIVGQNRAGFYYSYRAEYVDVVFVYVVSLVCGAIGLLFLRRYYRDTFER